MAQLDWGKGIGLHFRDEAEYYEALGYLAKNPMQVKVYTHKNDRSGAWAGQGKLHTRVAKDILPDGLRRSFEESGDDRLSVTDYVRNLVDNHAFDRFRDPTDRLYTFYRFPDSVDDVRATVPKKHLKDFDRGYNR
ncbi:MAG: hypothetical protein NC420_11220 [Eubacterium sp.]|nr:hypothetical protein [Eubacterium sp.]MCM1214204.1 hypothetical protein [Lachnospiraceae bacterium]MCM1302637.1 hypothetical protein [Butyrivibrio sp.]MCM1342234.1 hypothetical protein [Muribaculaceae bacterium]MCM1238136.1 hypothetical protein [Lachnospiraceae bacterium]